MMSDTEVLDGLLDALDRAGFPVSSLLEDSDSLLAELKSFVARAADWKAEKERLDALSMKMAERIDKLTLDKETLRDKVGSLDQQVRDLKTKPALMGGGAGGAFC